MKTKTIYFISILFFVDLLFILPKNFISGDLGGTVLTISTFLFGLIVLGLIGGYFTGQSWWRFVYIEHRCWKKRK